MSDREWREYQKKELLTRMKEIVDIDRTEIRRAGKSRDPRNKGRLING